MTITKQDLIESQTQAWAELEQFVDPSDERMLFNLNGFAGTGKSSLLTLFALDHPMRLCSFTGKASSVLTGKLAQLGSEQGATTIHGLRYKLVDVGRDPETGKKILHFERVDRNFVGQVIGIDEVSMLNVEMARDLITTNAKIITVGDNFQLPPVKGDRFVKDQDVDFWLTEVMRQALENSAVLRQVCNVRTKGRYEADGNDFRTVAKLSDADLLEADVVLCFRNATRHRINKRIRKMRDLPDGIAKAGEQVMALKNCHRFGIYNGATYTVANDFDLEDGSEILLEMGDGIIKVPRVAFVPPGGSLDDFDDDQHLSTIFDWGYASTVHKAQGSEWPRVAMVDEYARPEYPRQWRYTGLSRASQSIVVQR